LRRFLSPQVVVVLVRYKSTGVRNNLVLLLRKIIPEFVCLNSVELLLLSHVF